MLLPAPLLLVLLLSAAPVHMHEMLLRAAGGGRSYAAPGRIRGAAEEAFFRALLAAAASNSPAALTALGLPAQALGFQLYVGEDEGDGGARVAVLIESERRGAGAYVVRIGAARETFVQAPHALSDKGTLGIALAVYRSLHARALAVSSVHRSAGDVAHDAHSTFQRMTLAFLARSPGATVAQLHGFADTSAPHDVILSAGDGSPAPAWLGTATQKLAGALPDARVAAFPDMVSVLGGTTNEQGRATRTHGARFVHVELSSSLRRRLRDGTARTEFAAAFASAMTD